MKYYTVCFKCNEPGLPLTSGFLVSELNSDLYNVVTCPQGHKIISEVGQNLFDVLYTSGVYAYVKECYSESLVTLTASLERAYEFFIKSCLIKADTSLDTIDLFWKEIASQSERQYGAFSLAYCSYLKENWKANQEMVKFRNAVIHKGYIASSNEAENYGSYVTECLGKIIKALKHDFSEECIKLYFHSRQKISKKISKEMRNEAVVSRTSAHVPSLLRWHDSTYVQTDFKSNVLTLEGWNKVLDKL